MFRFLIIVTLCSFLLSACTASPSASVPTQTATRKAEVQNTPTLPPTTTPTFTPEPTATPKSPEQIAAEDASTAFDAGARLGGFEGWADIQTAAEYYNLYRNSANPERVTDEDLERLDSFVHEMRRLTFIEAVSTQFDAAKQALVETSKNAMVPGVRLPEEIEALDQAGLVQYYESLNLSPKGRRLTDEILALMTGRDQFITPTEVMTMERDRNGQVLFASNVTRGKVTGSGYYGFFERGSQDYVQNGPEYAPMISETYTIPMFGRNVSRVGVNPGNDPLMADYVGRFPLPHTSLNGLWGVLLWMKTPDGKIYEHAFAAATRSFTISAGSLVFGMYGTNDDIWRYKSVLAQNLPVETRIAVDKDNYTEFIMPLAPESLQAWAGWPPFGVKIYPGYIQLDERVSAFFDPETGLQVISSSTSRIPIGYNGYLFFGTDFHNPWP